MTDDTATRQISIESIGPTPAGPYVWTAGQAYCSERITARVRAGLAARAAGDYQTLDREIAAARALQDAYQTAAWDLATPAQRVALAASVA